MNLSRTKKKGHPWYGPYKEWLAEEAMENRKHTQQKQDAFKAGWSAALATASLLERERAIRSLDKRRNHEADAILNLIVPPLIL